MRIQFLGTSSALAAADRGPSALLIGVADPVLCDCGDGTARALEQAGVAAGDLAAVIITHTHPDHCSGLVWVLQQMRLGDRSRELTVYLPPPAVAGVKAMLAWYAMEPEKYPFSCRFTPLSREAFHPAEGLEAEAIPNDHMGPGSGEASFSIVFRERHRSVLYTSDIPSFAHLKREERYALAIAECTHVTPADIREAIGAGAERIILTHIPPQGCETGGGPAGFAYAADGQIIEV
ncbi:ribonuclease Z [bacterium]|nr:ribonuclease Z [bacterium]